MKICFAVIFFLFFSCQKKEPSPKKSDVVIALGFILGCQYSSNNPLFVNPYYNRYASDLKQYTYLILGNSTEDIACNSFEGYKGKDTGCFPVSGNKLSDMESQLCVLNTIKPQWIIAGTMGGNDLLGQIPDEETIRRGKSFVDATNLKYPESEKIFIKVHLTRVDYANQHRTKTNTEISNYAILKGWKVLDPDSCFQVDSDGRALQSNLLDAIHPNSEAMFCIKNKIKSEFGVEY